jgi:hypothetical protein
MSPINDGGPAFPFGQVSELTGHPINGFFAPGMSLRDWFAGQALGGMCAKDAHRDWLAQQAYEIADAMIERREQK